jgi:hypothetical protein
MVTEPYVGFVAAGRPHVGYLFMAGLLVLIGVALRIEAAIRYVNAKRSSAVAVPPNGTHASTP